MTNWPDKDLDYLEMDLQDWLDGYHKPKLIMRDALEAIRNLRSRLKIEEEKTRHWRNEHASKVPRSPFDSSFGTPYVDKSSNSGNGNQ